MYGLQTLFYDPPPFKKINTFIQVISLPVRNWESYNNCEQCLQMAVQAVWIFSFPALTDGIFNMVVTESILVLLLERNEGFRWLEKVYLVFYQRECLAKNRIKVSKNEDFSPRLGHKEDLVSSAAYDTSLAFLGNKIKQWIIFFSNVSLHC